MSAVEVGVEAVEAVEASAARLHPAARWQAAAVALMPERACPSVSGRLRVVREPLSGAVVSAAVQRMPSQAHQGDPDPSEGRGGPRGVITGWTAASRRRWLEALAPFVAGCLVLRAASTSLTYGAEPPQDGSECKRHLDAYFQRVRRAYPHLCAMWKLEFQRPRPGGAAAPHYHPLTAGFRSDAELAGFGPWASEAWRAITGDGGSRPADRAVRAAVTKPVTDPGGLLAYLLSERVGGRSKGHQLVCPEGFSPGRWWGYHNRAAVEAASVPVVDEFVGGGVLERRLARVDRVMRPAAGGVLVHDPGGRGLAMVTFPAQALRHHAARYVVDGDEAHLVALRDALAKGSGVSGPARLAEAVGW